MSAPQFTPGPWRLDCSNGERLVLSPLEATDEMGETYPVPVCDLMRGGFVVDDLGYSLDANARLIAASPTMAEYIQRKAAEGDEEAARIMELVHAGR